MSYQIKFHYMTQDKSITVSADTKIQDLLNMFYEQTNTIPVGPKISSIQFGPKILNNEENLKKTAKEIFKRQINPDIMVTNAEEVIGGTPKIFNWLFNIINY